MAFGIRPAGRGAPKIDPKPISDGWKPLESTAMYRAAGKNPLFGSDGQAATIGQILLMSKEQLQARVLDDPRIDIYACRRKDISLMTPGRLRRRRQRPVAAGPLQPHPRGLPAHVQHL